MDLIGKVCFGDVAWPLLLFGRLHREHPKKSLKLLDELSILFEAFKKLLFRHKFGHFKLRAWALSRLSNGNAMSQGMSIEGACQ